jgi:chemotaxis protein MotA
MAAGTADRKPPARREHERSGFSDVSSTAKPPMRSRVIGMIQMFANMSDPSKLGPLMAIALLATLYGALVANLVCLPIADKLHGKLEEENVSRSLIIDGILLIRD